MSTPAARRPRICFFGAAPGTGNLGVSALNHATLAPLFRRCPELEVTVFDARLGGERRFEFLSDGARRELRLFGARNSVRFWQSECLHAMRIANRLGGLGNPGLAALREADAVIDISGGDSFTDLYGRKRFGVVALPKLIALEHGRPLVLLPQTYGPFASPRRQTVAARIVAGARQAWARDPRSFERLRQLGGAGATHLRLGLDVAFGLESRPAAEDPCPELEAWAQDEVPVAGVNVSGLVLLDPDAGRRFGFRADYGALVRGTIEGLVADGARVVLVPHVLAPPSSHESDPEACERARAELPTAIQPRVAIARPPYGPEEVKHLISGLDWFVGTRMHATIAALSSGVPAAAVAYSLKFQGVFDTCEVGEHVVDPRALDTRPAVAAVLDSWHRRAEARATLARVLPDLRARLDEQMDEIAAAAIGEEHTPRGHAKPPCTTTESTS